MVKRKTPAYYERGKSVQLCLQLTVGTGAATTARCLALPSTEVTRWGFGDLNSSVSQRAWGSGAWITPMLESIQRLPH